MVLTDPVLAVAAMFLVVGLAVGSFLNVCIYRIPRGCSIVRPRSHCPACGRTLAWFDLIPVVSFIALRGRCRSCGAAISPRYPAVELLTGAFFAWCSLAAATPVLAAKTALLAAFLIAVAFIDLDHQIIPDGILIWLAAVGVAADLAAGDVSLLDALGGAMVGGGLLLAVALVSRGGMGGGDIKFAAALGIWLGWKVLLAALLLAFVLGGAAGVALLALGIKKRRDMIPFGPFISAGAFAAALYGPTLVEWYCRRFLAG